VLALTKRDSESIGMPFLDFIPESVLRRLGYAGRNQFPASNLRFSDISSDRNELSTNPERGNKRFAVVFERSCLNRRKMVRPERFELPTFWFVARRSIQLS
jgi:hypothetical protein